MDLAERVVDDATAIDEADLQRLRDLGLSEREIMDVILAAAARCFFSKTLDALGVARRELQRARARAPRGARRRPADRRRLKRLATVAREQRGVVAVPVLVCDRAPEQPLEHRARRLAVAIARARRRPRPRGGRAGPGRSGRPTRMRSSAQTIRSASAGDVCSRTASKSGAGSTSCQSIGAIVRGPVGWPDRFAPVLAG